MAYTHYDRLTALDSSFLDLESDNVHMHVGAVGIFEGGPHTTPEGGIDFERVMALASSALARVPRFRERLAHIPLTGQPVWVDDAYFNLRHHLRHTALPRPGDERQLKRLVGRIMSQKLDLSRPAWEMWFVEGLEGGSFAVVSKIHHCLIDGISGVDLLAAFMGVDPEHRARASEYPWMPRPAPSPAQLLGNEIWRRMTAPGRALVDAVRTLGSPVEAIEQGAHAVAGFAETLGSAMVPASPTPFNVPIGPHRRFDWARFDLDIVKEVRTRLRGTVNDVVLACVAGAARRYLGDRTIDVDDIDFRAMVPVSLRQEDQRGKLGNRVSLLVASLPVSESDPRRRFERVVEETRQLKGSGQAQGSGLIEEISDATLPGLVGALGRLAANRRTYNLVVTNVPGPPVPVYLDGARMTASYPLVPLFDNQALGVALFSYDGELFWGFNSCWDALADLHDFVDAIEFEFEVLRKL